MSDAIDPFANLDVVPEPVKTKNPKIKKDLVPKKIIQNVEKSIEDDPKIKQKLIMSIQKYGNNKRFGKYLKDQGHNFKHAYLKKLNVEELKMELAKQELALSNKSNTSMVDKGIKSVIIFGEQTVSKTTKYKLNGLTDDLYSNEHYLDLVERAKLKHFNVSIKLDPLLEMAFVIGQTAVIVHGRNSFEDSLNTETKLDEVIEDNIDFE